MTPHCLGCRKPVISASKEDLINYTSYIHVNGISEIIKTAHACFLDKRLNFKYFKV